MEEKELSCQEIIGFSKLRMERNANEDRKIMIQMMEDISRGSGDVDELDTYRITSLLQAGDAMATEYKFEIPFQKGSIKTNGRNGVMIEELLEIVATRITDLNEKFQCKENEEAVAYIVKALEALDNRTRDRIARQVEGVHTK